MEHLEVIKHLEALKAGLVNDMAKFASKRSVSHQEKVENANQRRKELLALETAIELCEIAIETA